MKRFLLGLAALLFALTGAEAQNRAVCNGGAGGGSLCRYEYWWHGIAPVPVLDLNFVAGRCYVAGSGDQPIGNCLSLTRTTTEYGTWADGHVSQFSSGQLVLTNLGLQINPAITNIALWSNDLTQATWTKTTMSAALTATGPDLGTNDATTLTATSANATALQSITNAITLKVYSVYLKRLSGSGAISLTEDNGTGWTACTLTLNVWVRCSKSQTLANPTIGVQIATNGDSVAAWCNQVETVNGVPTSPIPTTSGSASRNADQITLAAGAYAKFPTTMPYTAFAAGQFYDPYSAGDHFAFQHDDGTNNNRANMRIQGTSGKLAGLTVAGGSTVLNAVSNVLVISSGTNYTAAISYASANYNYTLNQSAIFNPTTAGAYPTSTEVWVGGAWNNQNVSLLTDLAFWNTALPTATLLTLK